MTRCRMALRGSLAVLVAAALCGAAAPAAKALLGSIEPLVLAGLLYAGAGLALALRRLAFGGGPVRPSPGSAARLGAAIVAGGVLAPVALLWGLARTTASAASILLVLETIFTALVAARLFGEPVGVRVGIALACVALGGAIAGWEAEATAGLLGGAAIALACALWALDNNWTRDVVDVDADVIVIAKGAVAALVDLMLAAALGLPLPGLRGALAALVVGAFGYGASLVLFVRGLRTIGAARTAVLFATAPGFGLALSIVALGEPLGLRTLAAAAFLTAGLAAIFAERHAHLHEHPETEHAHEHVHDDHHRHAHDGSEGVAPHVHRHRHERLVHDHPHAPDLHHRHEH